MILVKYSSENGGREYIVVFDNDATPEEFNDFCDEGISIDGDYTIPDITAFPMRYRMIRE